MTAPRVALLTVFLTAVAACGSRTGLETSFASSTADAGPCADSPAGPTVLAALGDFTNFQSPFALTVFGDTVYFAVHSGNNNPLGIYGVPATGGAPPRELIAGVFGCAESPFGYGPVATDGAFLYTPQEDEVSLCGGASLRVTTYDLRTGALSALPNPAEPAEMYVNNVLALPGRGVFWILGSPYGPSFTYFVRWDGSETAIVATMRDWVVDFVVAGDQVFLQSDTTLYQAPLDGTGDAAAVVDTLVADHSALLGGNSSSAFYTKDGSTILRRDVTGGAVGTVATTPGARLAHVTAWVDEDWVYFAGAGAPTASGGMLRVPVSGGPVSTFWASDWLLTGVTSDACNVYWLADEDFTNSLPSEVLYQRR